MRKILLFLFLILIACSSSEKEEEVSEGYVCSDGKFVVSEENCVVKEPESSVDDSIPVKRPLKSVHAVETVVSSAEDAEQIFLDYIDLNNLTYDIISSEVVQTDKGEFYRVNYKHYRMGGGIGYLLVDKNGEVYEELTLA